MSDQPFQNGQNGDGRDSKGRFVNRPGPGAPKNKLRARLAKAIRAKDIDTAVKVLRYCMGGKDIKPSDRLAAAREILDRACGRPVQADLLERIEALEALLNERELQHEHP